MTTIDGPMTVEFEKDLEIARLKQNVSDLLAQNMNQAREVGRAHAALTAAGVPTPPPGDLPARIELLTERVHEVEFDEEQQLLDKFAMAALTGVTSTRPMTMTSSEMAEWAYQVALRMLWVRGVTLHNRCATVGAPAPVKPETKP